MSRERPTEQTYASDLKDWIGQVILEENLPFKSAKVEMVKERRRADILVFDKDDNCVFIIEVKRPEEADAPYDPKVLEQATEYAKKYQPSLRHFATHNVNFLVLWDSITLRSVGQFAITYITQLDEYLRKTDEIKDSVRKFLKWYARFLQGEPPKRIDESIAEVLHNYIRGIVNTTDLVNELVDSYVKDVDFRKNFEVWLADNGWEDPRGDKKKLENQCVTLAKQYTYLFVNKILFYNVLKQRYSNLSNIALPKDLTSTNFYTLLQTYFNIAILESKNYQTVFQTNFVDKIPIPSNTINELLKIIQYLQSLDFSVLGYDIIGKVFEKLIPREERHTLGQYFTRSDVVDLIIGFCIKDSNAAVLDPGCGSGTFLIESYYRLKYLEGKKTHTQLLEQLWGIDIAKFPAHLSTINLAIQDLSVRENYPNIVYKDFFEVFPKTQVKIGVQSTLHAYGVPESESTVTVKGLDKAIIEKRLPIMTAVVGNPPYTRQEEMLEEIFGRDYKKDTLLAAILKDFPKIDFSLRASIYAYFFVHGLKFLNEGGRLGFVTLRSWLDVGYGEALKRFFLSHCKIVAVIESKEERWFHEAQMLPCITILESYSSKKQKEQNLTKFVQLKAPLASIAPPISDEREMVQEIYRWKQIDSFVADIENAENLFEFKEVEFFNRKIRFFEDEKFRIVVVAQKDLEKDTKWGKYLTAPSAFFKLLEKSKEFVAPLENIAKIKRGVTTGANEFFCLPNRFFKIREEDKHIVLIDKGTNKDRFWIEREYLGPVVNKIKPHKSISDIDPDGYLLMVQERKGQLKKKRKRVLQYIEYGEKKEHTWRRKHFKGYHERPTCASRTLWYSINERPKSGILSPSIFWGRHIVFRNKGNFYSTDCLDEVNPYKEKHSEILAALMNSTFSALFYEFSGRYIENRDKTISNEIKIYELKKIPCINPDIVEKKFPTLIQELENALQSIETQEVKPLFEEITSPQRQKLDEIVFCKILGLTKTEMKEICNSAGALFKQRIERLSESKP
jgi:type I restriction enzyme M protein